MRQLRRTSDDAALRVNPHHARRVPVASRALKHTGRSTEGSGNELIIGVQPTNKSSRCFIVPLVESVTLPSVSLRHETTHDLAVFLNNLGRTIRAGVVDDDDFNPVGFRCAEGT